MRQLKLPKLTNDSPYQFDRLERGMARAAKSALVT